MRMRCTHVRRLMPLAIDDEIVEWKRESFQSHLAECARCREEYLRIERAVEMLERAPLPEPRTDFAAAVMVRLREARRAMVSDRGPNRITWHMPILTALATLCIVLSWNEWILPQLVYLAGESLALIARSSRVFGPIVTVGGALVTLARSLAEALLALLRSETSSVLSLYGLTLAAVLTTVFLVRTRSRRLGSSVFCF
jgi:predicted anti-sigma-YlaC factor YlaD